MIQSPSLLSGLFFLFKFVSTDALSGAQLIGVDLVEDVGYFNQRSAFLLHCAGVRNLILSCHLFLSVETNNGGHPAVVHYKWLEEAGLVEDVTLLRESTQAGRPGVWTSGELKSSMTDDLQRDLKSGRLLVYSGMVGRKPAQDVKELKAEFERFARYRTPAGRVKLTGKGPNGSQNDDGAMSLLLAHAMYKTVCSPIGSKKYKTWSMMCSQELPVHKTQDS